MIQSHEFFHQYNQVSRNLSKKINERLADIGIFSSQWSIIYYLYHHGPCTLVEISNYLNVEAPTVTRTVNRLESLQWIRKTEGKDRREKRIELTDIAMDNYPSLIEKVGQFESDVMEGISEDEKVIAFQVLRKMMTNMDYQR
ncbi:MarR family winged helix-turn-helix transcriptional regulator [Heyndrickxia sp. NPDC080065]|uniref:MarR family winged helix-turn-helix transcriptional regulator n=1 Tax=Heyndrickxia sp. NPDC080065 TaxID=3390568 RepID=UPI003D070E6A